LPSTAREPYINVGNISQVDNNIHAGTKYMRYMLDNYFDDDELDELNRYLFTFAAYNAGPNRIVQLRREAARQGLNPNVWSDNVEKVAARRIGQETVRYVNGIAQRYIAYRRSFDLNREKHLALTR
jgi:membrane-bound lytic murein transglycosylase MltF